MLEITLKEIPSESKSRRKDITEVAEIPVLT
jgi:hypothetical protein